MDIMQKIKEYSALFDRSPMACAILHMLKDADGSSEDFELCYANEAFAGMVGYPDSMLKGSRFYRLFPGADQKWLTLFDAVAFQGGERGLIGYSAEAGRYLHVHCFQLCEGYCAAFLRDASEEKQAELRGGEQLLLCEEICGLYTIRLDSDLTLLYGNDRFYDIHEYTREKLRERLDNKCVGYIHPDDLGKVRNAVHAALSSGGGFSVRAIRILTGEGHIKYVRASGVLEQRDGGPVLNGVTVDITAQIAAELAAKRQKQDLERQYERALGIHKGAPDGLCSFHLNLTRNLYIDGIAASDWLLKLGESGTADGFFEHAYLLNTDPALLEEFKRTFNRKNLIGCFHRGETALSLKHKYLVTPKHSEWIATGVMMMRNPDTWDVEGVLYAKSIDHEKNLQAIISRFLDVEYEYIALIETPTGMLSIERPLNGLLLMPPISSGYYPDVLADTASRLILKSDAESARKEMSLEAIAGALERTDIYTCSYFIVTPDGEKQRKKWQFTYLDDSRTVIAFTRSDISKQYRMEYDELTGLYNRSQFYEEARHLLNEYPQTEFVLIRFDIDRFKIYNDIYGTKAGDRLLAEIGQLYRRTAVKPSVEGHLEADHFIICIPKSNMKVEQYLAETSEFLRGIQPDFDFVPRIGIYEITDRDLDIRLMCDRALLALRSIKGSYTERIALYNESMRRTIIEQQELIKEFETAIKEEQFRLYIQPQYNTVTNQMIGAEVLVRWLHPEKGLISPAKFIPVFEHNGFISRMDEYVWERSCAFLSKWKKTYGKTLPLSLNVSRIDIYNPHLCDILYHLVQKYGIAPEDLHLEITETAYMENPAQLIGIVTRLKDMGFYIEMDDFGNGYSSLNTLKNVPVDLLKLDMKFLSADDNTGRSGIILNSVVRMAHWLQLPVLAEGVETRRQAEYLKSIGCDLVQGYYYARPMPVGEYEELLRGETMGAVEKSSQELGIVEIQDFWSSDSRSTVIFNRFMNAAGLFEFCKDHVEPLRANDRFFELCGVSREKFLNGILDFQEELSRDALERLIRMANTANDTGKETECEIHWRNPEKGSVLLLHLRGFVAARSTDRFILLIVFEDITAPAVPDRDPVLLQLLSDNDLLGVFQMRLDEGFTVLYGNRRFFQIHGFLDAADMERCNGSKAVKCLSPFDAVSVRKILSDAVSNKDAGVQFQTRIVRKGGSERWVSCWGCFTKESGADVLCGCLMDITGCKETEAQLEVLNERYRIALENSSAAIWEYDFRTKSIKQSENSMRAHGYQKLMPNVPESLIEGGYIHPDSVADYRGMYERLRRGEKSVEGVFLVKTEGREGYSYEHISYTNLLDKAGRPYCAVGISRDVTDQRKAEEELRRRADTDAMTGLYNKMTTEELIKKALASPPGEPCVLIIADIDGLKSINDLLGHCQGDRAIIAIADTLKHHFRESDIIGRVGGDEYMVFLKGALSEARLRGKLSALLRALSKLRVGEKDDVPVRASVGAAMGVTGKDDFSSLYKMADTALYQVKRGGKGNYAFYEPSMRLDGYMCRQKGKNK